MQQPTEQRQLVYKRVRSASVDADSFYDSDSEGENEKQYEAAPINAELVNFLNEVGADQANIELAHTLKMQKVISVDEYTIHLMSMIPDNQ